ECQDDSPYGVLAEEPATPESATNTQSFQNACRYGESEPGIEVKRSARSSQKDGNCPNKSKYQHDAAGSVANCPERSGRNGKYQNRDDLTHNQGSKHNQRNQNDHTQNSPESGEDLLVGFCNGYALVEVKLGYRKDASAACQGLPEHINDTVTNYESQQR